MRQPVPFGKYLLLDRISVGGMAEVFKAKSYGVEGFEKIIAIKRILPTMGEDRDFIKMFIDEAKIAGQLAHANICQIFELGRIDGSHFIAMEYIWGKDLLQIQNRLRKIKQQMPVPMACFSIAKVLEGLDYAHRKRDPLGRPLEIVHRDCSPQNVLVSYEGEVKVIDFGIAKATSRNSRTMAGVLKGKFGYMSPEQVRGLPLDRRSDIFALGTMLYECLTGERLFQGETDFSTLEKVRNVDIAPPRSINPDIPEEVERVILKALAKDVDDRYQWCSEMLTDLQAHLMGQDVVFTAKTLSSWLKDIFQTEIDRERQQLEQYKRVGRDGLIGGLPSAEADKDVVSQLGEAGVPEGDATTLGGPSFDDIELALANAAAPNVGAPPRAAARPPTADDDSNDFGEEAPTEIFGDALDVSNLPGMAEHQAMQAAAQSRPATSPPQSKPPPKPSGRAQTLTRPQEVPVGAAGNQMAAQQPRTNSPSAPPMPPPPQYAGAQASPGQGYPQPQYQQPYSDPSQPVGTPNSMAAQQHAGLANHQNPARTVLGMSAPNVGPGMTGPQQMPPGYPQQNPYPQHPSGPQQQQPYGAPYRPSGQQPVQPGFSQYPQYQQGPGPYPSRSMPGYAPPNQYSQYGGSGPMQATSATPLEGLQQQPEGKRSTLVRDILIGVAIAALVLGGFFVVKIFILDKKDEAPVATTSTIATIHIGMAAGVTADLLVDEKKIATVMDGQDIPVSAGRRHVVLVGPGGGKCEVNVTLEAGKTTPLKCQLASTPAAGSAAGSDAAGGSAAPMSGSASGSAASGSSGSSGSGSGSAISPASGSGAGSAKAAAVVVPPPTDKTVAHPTTPTTTPTTKSDTKSDTKADTKSDTKAETKASVDAKKTDVAKTDTKLDKQTMPSTEKTTTKKTTDAAADTSGKGYLAITSKPTAKILVDGVDSGLSTPISGKALSVAPGKHKITFVMGDDRYTFPVTVTAGKTEQLDKDLQ